MRFQLVFLLGIVPSALAGWTAKFASNVHHPPEPCDSVEAKTFHGEGKDDNKCYAEVPDGFGAYIGFETDEGGTFTAYGSKDCSDDSVYIAVGDRSCTLCPNCAWRAFKVT